MKLHRLGEPICLVGEGPANRKERLTGLMYLQGKDFSEEEATTSESKGLK